MTKDIIKIPAINLKGPNTFGKNVTADKMLAAVKNFFSKKK